jgi:uncharacterized protein
MKYLKAIILELIITASSIGTIIFTILRFVDHWAMWFPMVSATFAILYMIYRINKSVNEIKEKEKFDLLVNANLHSIMESIKYYISLIIINGNQNCSLHGKTIKEFKDAAAIFHTVDFRKEDPYTGTSMGNLAEQVGSGMDRVNSDLNALVFGYGHRMRFKVFELYDKLKRNTIYHQLVNFQLFYDQMMMFQEAAKSNPTYPKEGLPITISLAQEEFIIAYAEMIDLVFELQNVK